MNQKTKGRLKKAGVAVGASAAAAAAVAAGTYFLFAAKGARQRRKKIADWAAKAGKEVSSRLKKLPKVDEEIYAGVVEQAFRKYKGLRNIDPRELSSAVREMKGHWRNIQKSLRKPAKSTASSRPRRRK